MRFLATPKKSFGAATGMETTTCWRMTLDLNRILLYANPDGSFRTTPKRYFSLIDGIQAMEGNGPVAGTPKDAGLSLPVTILQRWT